MYILTSLTLLVVFWFLWRFYSNRHKLPCPTWLSWMVELDNPFAKAHKADTIINMLPLKKGIRVLEVGCGPGRVMLRLAEKLAEHGGHVTGLDIQKEMVAKASNNASDLGLHNLDFICGDVSEIPIRNHYDVILMVCVLGEIPKPVRETTISKLREKLQTDGLISITETMFDPHFQSHNTVMQLMEKLGFKQVNFTGNKLAYTAHFQKR